MTIKKIAVHNSHFVCEKIFLQYDFTTFFFRIVLCQYAVAKSLAHRNIAITIKIRKHDYRRMCATCIIHSVSWLFESLGDAEAAFFNVGRPILDFAKPSAWFRLSTYVVIRFMCD